MVSTMGLQSLPQMYRSRVHPCLRSHPVAIERDFDIPIIYLPGAIGIIGLSTHVIAWKRIAPLVGCM